MSVLHVKYKYLKIAICVKTATTSFFVMTVITKGKISRVCMPIATKNIMFTQKYSEKCCTKWTID